LICLLLCHFYLSVGLMHAISPAFPVHLTACCMNIYEYCPSVSLLCLYCPFVGLLPDHLLPCLCYPSFGLLHDPLKKILKQNKSFTYEQKFLSSERKRFGLIINLV
jgi:hypothetical protein